MRIRVSGTYETFLGYEVRRGPQTGSQQPAPPAAMPDGSTAGRQEMLAAMWAVRRYNSNIETYLKWLEFEEMSCRIDATTRTRLHNAAVDTLRETVERFNRQVRLFEARDDVRPARARMRSH